MWPHGRRYFAELTDFNENEVLTTQRENEIFDQVCRDGYCLDSYPDCTLTNFYIAEDVAVNELKIGTFYFGFYDRDQGRDVEIVKTTVFDTDEDPEVHSEVVKVLDAYGYWYDAIYGDSDE